MINYKILKYMIKLQNCAAVDTLNNHAIFIKTRIIIKAIFTKSKSLITTNTNLSDKL